MLEKLFADGAHEIDLTPGEYRGPLTIKHECILDGHGSTIWCEKEPALIIDADNVTIKNLRIELTNTDGQETVVVINGQQATFEEVEVYGQVKEGAQTSKPWTLPRLVNLGQFAADAPNEFLVKVVLGEDCYIQNEVYGLTVTPEKLTVGATDLKLKVDSLPDAAIIYGSFRLKTERGIHRRIYLTGRSTLGADVHTVVAENFALSLPPEAIPTEPVGGAVQLMTKGQRIAAPSAREFCLTFTAQDTPEDIEVDAYVFCLQADRLVHNDSDIIFFNQPQHVSGAVRLDSVNPGSVWLELSALPVDIQRLAVCFSIYDDGDGQQEHFRRLHNPKVSVCADGKATYEFPMELDNEKTVTALEFYLHNGAWKINFVGAGYNDGLVKLCQSYGVNVR